MTQPTHDRSIDDLIDLARFSLDRPDSADYTRLVAEHQADWRDHGAFRLAGFLKPDIAVQAAAELTPLMRTASFRHRHNHNIYFSDERDSLPFGLGDASLTTSHSTLTCDQMAGSIIRQVYEWDPLCGFLRDVLDLPELHRVADPLACLNVMEYGRGDTLDWHFDRAKFAVTILLQEPDAGGQFEYRRALRRADNPNHAGVRRFLDGEDSDIRTARASAGTMTVFAGFGSAHRVAPVTGQRPRIMAVLSFMEEANHHYSAEDRIRFYGRAEPV